MTDADERIRLAAESKRLAGMHHTVAQTWEQLASCWHNADHPDPAAVRMLPSILTGPNPADLVSWALRMADECHVLLRLSFAAAQHANESGAASLGHRAIATLSTAPARLHEHLEERLSSPTWTSLKRWASRPAPEVLALAELALASLALARETHAYHARSGLAG